MSDSNVLKTLDTIARALGCDDWDNLVARFPEAVKEIGGRKRVLALAESLGLNHVPQEIVAFLEGPPTKAKLKTQLATTPGVDTSVARCRAARLEFQSRIAGPLEILQDANRRIATSLGGRKAQKGRGKTLKKKLEAIMGSEECGPQEAKRILAEREGYKSVRQIERIIVADTRPAGSSASLKRKKARTRGSENAQTPALEPESNVLNDIILSRRPSERRRNQ